MNDIVISLLVYLVIFTGIIAVSFRRFIRKVEPETALIRSGNNGRVVSYDKIFVIPLIHSVDVVDLSIKGLEISTTMKDKKNCDVPLNITLITRIDNSSSEVLLDTIDMFGSSVVCTAEFCFEHFNSKTIDAVQRVIRNYDSIEVTTSNNEIKSQAKKYLTESTVGFIIDDLDIQIDTTSC